MQSLSQVQNQLSKTKALLTGKTCNLGVPEKCISVPFKRLGRAGETFPLDKIVSTTSLQT